MLDIKKIHFYGFVLSFSMFRINFNWMIVLRLRNVKYMMWDDWLDEVFFLKTLQYDEKRPIEMKNVQKNSLKLSRKRIAFPFIFARFLNDFLSEKILSIYVDPGLIECNSSFKFNFKVNYKLASKNLYYTQISTKNPKYIAPDHRIFVYYHSPKKTFSKKPFYVLFYMK